MELSTLTAISPIDGRYHDKLVELQPIYSEYGLIRTRIFVEIEWLCFLTKHINKPLSLATENKLKSIYQNFDLNHARKIKEIEQKIKHDVKAVEYFLREECNKIPELADLVELIHFACTSEDINNLAYGLLLKDSLKQSILLNLQNLVSKLTDMAHIYAEQPMLSRTHGQPATPTTFGKEIANFIARLQKQINQLTSIEIMGKFNGAVGNFNAHYIAYPELNWSEISKNFVTTLGLTWNKYTTQIEPHDGMAEIFQTIIRCNNILFDLCRDLWSYIAIDYLQQKTATDEVGSSVMPHKVNPIDFENAEGNLGLANAMLNHFAQKLPISRWQRDLSDSTVLRNIGTAFAYTILAYKSTLQGLNKIIVNAQKLNADLDSNWIVLTEAIQTVMRRYNIAQGYEKLKDLTRGKKISKEMLHNFIDTLPLPNNVKNELKQFTPQTYIGKAADLAIHIDKS